MLNTQQPPNFQLIEGSMNPQIKKEWVQELRSGKYTQARGALHKGDNCFCVMGVLGNLYVNKFPIATWKEDKLVLSFKTYRHIHKRTKNPSLDSFDAGYSMVRIKRQDYVYTEPAKFVLPSEVMSWAALELRDASSTVIKQVGLKVNGELFTISKLNDHGVAKNSTPLTFDELATLIEIQL
jgi:hypothetical protein